MIILVNYLQVRGSPRLDRNLHPLLRSFGVSTNSCHSLRHQRVTAAPAWLAMNHMFRARFCLAAAEEGDLRGSGDVTVLRVDAIYDFALAFILRVISPPEEGWTSQRCIFADLWHVVEVHGSVLSPFNKQLPNQFLGTGPQSITWTLGHCPVLPWVFHVIMATMYIHHVCHLGRRSVQQWTMIPNST